MWQRNVICVYGENILFYVNQRDYWDLRTLNNAKPYFFLNEMNKKDLPAMYSTAF